MIEFDPEQIRIIDWRLTAKDIAAVIGPPGCGKTTVGGALACNMITTRLADRVLLTAYTNSATDEFGRELCYLLGDRTASQVCVRTGNTNAADQSLAIPFSNDSEFIKTKKIVLCTLVSLAKLPQNVTFDRVVVDEASINKIDHLLMPFQLSLKRGRFKAPFVYKSTFTDADYNLSHLQQQLKELMSFLSQCGIAATVVGDPKQSQPINLSSGERGNDAVYNSFSAIDWIIKSASHDTLHITHRLPDTLAGLVDDFAGYGGLTSAPEVAGRRLNISDMEWVDHNFKQIINPEDVITWIDMRKSEEIPYKESSWNNPEEAMACARICKNLVKLPTVTKNNSIVIITRFTGQVMAIRNLLARMGLLDNYNIKVTTTTTALGTQGDIVLFSLVRNNQDKTLGALAELPDLNVSISRAKKKLIIVGSFEMMAEGHGDRRRSKTNYAHNLARLVESKYGKLLEVPQILR
jgi:energy-coupling factor transporter ATP-binding protein EcfA2